MSEAGAVAARKSESVFVGSLLGNTEVEVGSEPSGSGVLLLTSSQSGSNGSFSVSSHPCIDFLSLGFGSSEGISSCSSSAISDTALMMLCSVIEHKSKYNWFTIVAGRTRPAYVNARSVLGVNGAAASSHDDSP